MIPVDVFFPFLMAVLLIEATPGPNMAYLAALTLAEGRRAGLAAVAGVATGLALVGVLAAAGLAELAVLVPMVWDVLRWVGIAYLLWLSWDAWNSASEISTSRAHHGGDSGARYFRRGVITNLLNPKAALFYIAMLPKFVSSDAPALPQIIVLTAISVGMATLIHLIIVALAAHAQTFLSSPGRSRVVRRVLAIGLLGITIWFALTTGR